MTGRWLCVSEKIYTAVSVYGTFPLQLGLLGNLCLPAYLWLRDQANHHVFEQHLSGCHLKVSLFLTLACVDVKEAGFQHQPRTSKINSRCENHNLQDPWHSCFASTCSPPSASLLFDTFIVGSIVYPKSSSISLVYLRVGLSASWVHIGSRWILAAYQIISTLPTSCFKWNKTILIYFSQLQGCAFFITQEHSTLQPYFISHFFAMGQLVAKPEPT